MSRTEFMCGEYADVLYRAKKDALEVAENIGQAVLCFQNGETDTGFFTGSICGYAEQLNCIVAAVQAAADNYYNRTKENEV